MNSIKEVNRSEAKQKKSAALSLKIKRKKVNELRKSQKLCRTVIFTKTPIN